MRDFRESEEIFKHFKVKNTGAAFQVERIPPTIWIRKGDVSDLEMFHESMHFEDFLRGGKKAYMRGNKRKILSIGNLSSIPERDLLISKYIKEKYVLDEVLEEQEQWIQTYGTGRWTQGEIDESIEYFEEFIKDIKNVQQKESREEFY